MSHLSRRGWTRGAARGSLAAAALALAACSDILEVTDPDVIDPSQLETPAATANLRAGVVLRLTELTTGLSSSASGGTLANDNLFLFGGLLADEWRSGDTFEQRNTTDQRTVVPENTFLPVIYRTGARVRTEAKQTIESYRKNAPTQTAPVGQMFAISAYATNLLAEHFCNGLVLSTFEGAEIVYGGPISVDSAFALAANEADSAIAVLTAKGTVTPTGDGLTYLNFARVVKARALVNRGQYAAAAAAVSAVPTTFKYQTSHSSTSRDNQNWSLNTSALRYVVADTQGGKGLPFATAKDPRVPTFVPTGSARLAFDSETPSISQAIWTRYDAVTIASGVEARLIEAEAQLAASNTAGYLTTLNTLRASSGTLLQCPYNSSGVRQSTCSLTLAPLTLPPTTAEQQDQLFYERAFWMFGTGHRLGDMRRAIRQYGRGPETVFPTGSYHKGGGKFGTRVNLPVPFDEQNNPNFHGCTNNNA